MTIVFSVSDRVADKPVQPGSEPSDAVPRGAQAAQKRSSLSEQDRADAREQAAKLQIQRRQELLVALSVPLDGPLQPVTRIAGVHPVVSRQRAAVGRLVCWGLVGAVAASVGLALAAHVGAFLALGFFALITVLTLVPLAKERQGTCVRHGKGHRFLSVRTRTGIRTVDLARLIRLEQRGSSLWALDAEGVTVQVASAYGRQALKRGVERWGLGEAKPGPAALRVLLRLRIRALVWHPIRGRAELG